MKVYKVKVNGKVYEVELESAKEVEGSIPKSTLSFHHINLYYNTI